MWVFNTDGFIDPQDSILANAHTRTTRTRVLISLLGKQVVAYESETNFVKHSTRKFLFGGIAVLALAGGLVIALIGSHSFLRWRKFTHGNKILLQKSGFKKCIPDVQYERELRDQLWTYAEHSKQHGIPLIPKNKRDIDRLVCQGILKELQQNDYYDLDTMYYSYPYLVQDAHELLIEIENRNPDELRLKFFYTTQFPEPSNDEERALLEMIKNAYMAADMDMIRIIREYAEMTKH